MPIDPNLFARFSRPPKNGTDLRAAFSTPAEPRLPIVAEFLYRRKLTFLVADPASGKSTVANQIAYTLACPTPPPVFGILDVPTPATTYYLAFETDWDEFQEAGKLIQPHIPFDPDRVCFDEELIGIDISNVEHAAFAIRKIVAARPDLVIVDPIFLLSSGDLKDGAIAASITNWMRRLAVECNAAILALHHTHRERVDAKGRPSKVKDRSYGSRFLKASATLFWQMSELDQHAGVELECLKDRYKLSRKKLTLNYDPSTRMVMGETGGRSYLLAELLGYLNSHKPGHIVNFATLSEVLECATGYIYELVKDPSIRPRLERVVNPNRTVVWKLL